MDDPHTFNLDLNQTRADFLKTELSVGLTFADIALNSKDDAKTERNRKNARSAYDAILKFIGGVALSKGESEEMASGMARLKSQLQELGEVF